MARLELTGQRFGQLEVLEFFEMRRQSYWLCVCDCGNLIIIRGSSLTCDGHSRCLNCVNIKHGYRRLHGKRHRMYKTWSSMIERCGDINATSYENYGKRGIYVCDEWKDPATFIQWTEQQPHAGETGYTLDRIDNDGPYAPWNCRFATKSEQAFNRRPKRVM